MSPSAIFEICLAALILLVGLFLMLFCRFGLKFKVDFSKISRSFVSLLFYKAKRQ
jgi:hypothetical protein